MGWIWLGVVAQFWRYRHRSDVTEQQQTRWVIGGFVGANLCLFLVLLLFFADFVAQDNGLMGNPAPFLFIVAGMGAMLIPITISIALFRYRLWEIDVIINRTLVYGGLTLVILTIYSLIVGGLGTLLQSRGNFVIALVATGLIAVLFQPVRERLQRGVNRLMFGERDDPTAVITRLGQRLEAVSQPDAVLPAIVETVTQALKLPYADIVLVDETVMAETGILSNNPLHLFPLVYQAETVGQLRVASRSPGEGLSPADERVLRQVALQAGTAVHAIRLTHDLQQSRVRIVTTREEERRRLRRDLHDELGPIIASQGLKLAAARELLSTNPEKAAGLLDDVLAKNQNTVAEVRRLVYNLRPPTLDELGLVGAIREYVQSSTSTGLKVTIEAPDNLPPLSAAVETAAYRIVAEAFTNVLRHAGANHCVINLAMQTAVHSLVINISDDGRGLPEDSHAGIGMQSMRERAEEVGGSFEIVSSGRGMCVTAVLPLMRENGAANA